MKLALSRRRAGAMLAQCIAVLALLGLAACGPVAPAAPPATIAPAAPTESPPSATAPPATPTVSPATPVATTPAATPTPAAFPLAQAGPYHVGARSFKFKDADRAGHTLYIYMNYPAVRPADATDNSPSRDAAPDGSGAPYPLLLTSAKLAGFFGAHLASRGFVVAGVDPQDASGQWGEWLIDYPRELLFALNQLASNPLDGLASIVDSDHAGALGYSFDSFTALALGGARADPQFYLAQCAGASAMQPAPPAWWIEYICAPAGDWEAFAAHAGAGVTQGADGLWRALTDARIRAVMPMAPEGAWMFGPRGLAAVDRPTLIIGATADDINFYDLEAVYIFQHLGAPDRAMISFVGNGHFMITDAGPLARMRHFATAFFGYYLQRREDYAGYFSEGFVAGQPDLAWGVYDAK